MVTPHVALVGLLHNSCYPAHSAGAQETDRDYGKLAEADLPIIDLPREAEQSV